MTTLGFYVGDKCWRQMLAPRSVRGRKLHVLQEVPWAFLSSRLQIDAHDPVQFPNRWWINAKVEGIGTRLPLAAALSLIGEAVYQHDDRPIVPPQIRTPVAESHCGVRQHAAVFGSVIVVAGISTVWSLGGGFSSALGVVSGDVATSSSTLDETGIPFHRDYRSRDRPQGSNRHGPCRNSTPLSSPSAAHRVTRRSTRDDTPSLSCGLARRSSGTLALRT